MPKSPSSESPRPSRIESSSLSLPTAAFGRAGRLFRMASTLAKAELSHRLTPGGGSPDSEKTREEELSLLRKEQAQILVEELGRLKGAAMKVGQMLSLEARDYLPDEVIQILEQLQNQVTAMPSGSVQEILRAELGAKSAELRDLTASPIAAASIGQVHSARLGEQKVAVKIQYPGIQESITSDMRILKSLLKGMALVMRREFEVDGVLQEFEHVFIQETDYLQEARAAARYREAAQGLSGIVVPRIHTDFSSSRVLTLDFEEGVPLTQWMRGVQGTRPSLEAREAMGRRILELYTEEFCSWGLVQTDPNPGNFLVHPESSDLILLDFGATKAYSEEFRKKYSELVLAIYERSRPRVKDIAIAMNLIDPRESLEAFEAFEDLVFESMRPLTLDRFDFKDDRYVENVRKMTQTLVKRMKFSPPPRDLIFLHRKLGGIFQFLRGLEVTLELKPYLTRFETLAHSTPTGER